MDPAVLAKLAGVYVTPAKSKFQVVYAPGTGIALQFPGGPPEKLIPIKGLQFRSEHFADAIWEFVMQDGQVKTLKARDPSGEESFSRE